jgi:hypothetical protein
MSERGNNCPDCGGLMPHSKEKCIETLREALRRYGEHRRTCDAQRPTDFCTCGLTAALGDTPDD